MPLRTTVYCTTDFEGFHRWPDAPEEVDFLRNRHRHRFHVRVEIEVTHDNRATEFILLRRNVEDAIHNVDWFEPETWSCEQWAKYLQEKFNAVRVEVSEDGENGAVVEVVR